MVLLNIFTLLKSLSSLIRTNLQIGLNNIFKLVMALHKTIALDERFVKLDIFMEVLNCQFQPHQVNQM